MFKESPQEPVAQRLRHVVAPGVEELTVPASARAGGPEASSEAVPEPGPAEETVLGPPIGGAPASPAAAGSFTADRPPPAGLPRGADDARRGCAELVDPRSVPFLAEDAVPWPDDPDRLPGDAVGSEPVAAKPVHLGWRLPGPNPFDPGRRGVRAMAVVAVLAVVIAAVLAWRARPRTEPVPGDDAARAVQSAVAEPADGGSDPMGGDAGPTAAAPGPTPAEVVVAVTGKVRRPGLVRLPAGARVADAVQAAGGLLPGADVAFLNLARKVTDGELILVGVTAPPGTAVQGGAPGASATGADGTTQPAGPVNLNTATLAQLDSLPGVGPVLAQRIIDYRGQHGAFRTVDDLRQVDGIGNARYEQLKKLVTV